MRSHLFKVDLDIVWATVTADLPGMKSLRLFRVRFQFRTGTLCPTEAQDESLHSVVRFFPCGMLFGSFINPLRRKTHGPTHRCRFRPGTAYLV